MGERPRKSKKRERVDKLGGSRHVFRFQGASVIPRRAPFLRDFLGVLIDGAQQATRLQMDGRSTAPGSPPAWLEAAAAFEISHIHDQEVVLRAPSLMDAAPQRFGQLELFANAATRSSLDFFEDSLDDALAGREDSDRYDRPLMSTLEGLGRLFRHGVESIEIINGRRLRVEREGIEAIRALRQRTPDDRRVIVAGKLDAIRHSDRAFTLILQSGESIRGVAADSIDPADLARLFGQPALVSGFAKFRPSGVVLRLEAERIERATGDVSVWSHVPRPLSGPIDPRGLRVPQGPSSGIAAIIGQLKGEETEEEFLAALEELS